MIYNMIKDPAAELADYVTRCTLTWIDDKGWRKEAQVSSNNDGTYQMKGAVTHHPDGKEIPFMKQKTLTDTIPNTTSLLIKVFGIFNPDHKAINMILNPEPESV